MLGWLPHVIAHAAPINYRFPLPVWVYAVGAGVAVLLSAPAAAAAVGRRERVRSRSPDIYPALRPLHLGAVATGAATILLVISAVGGYAARHGFEARIFFENPATVLIWVDFWVGLGLVSALVGNVWDFVSPLSAAVRALDRALARRGTPQREYPARLGQWPAVGLLLVWTWMELVWPLAKRPDVLMAIVLVYAAATFVGVAVYGAEPWLTHCELFTVFARTFARCGPIELTPSDPGEWIAADRDTRATRLRPYLAGLRDDAATPRGFGAFVVALLATVVFDGFSRTKPFQDLADSIFAQVPWFTFHVQFLATLLMLATAAIFIAVFLGAVALVGTREGGLTATASRYAPTLIPIAVVYFIAHYFTYLLFGGQATLGVVLDPLAKEWNPWGLAEYKLSTKFISPAAVWWTQIALIVIGHIAAIFAAHRAALSAHIRARNALLAQAPVIVLMVGYTVAGLWVLAQQLGRGV